MKVELHIFGMHHASCQIFKVKDIHGNIPNIQWDNETCREQLFSTITKLSMEWANPKLYDIVGDLEALTARYVCMLPLDTELLNKHSWEQIEGTEEDMKLFMAAMEIK